MICNFGVIDNFSQVDFQGMRWHFFLAEAMDRMEIAIQTNVSKTEFLGWKYWEQAEWSL